MKTLAMVAFLLLSKTLSQAGPQYVDKTGFAVSGYDVVAYFSLPQSEIGQSQVDAVPGQSSITADYNGETFAFSSVANRDIFLKNPEKYAPQYDGHCAYGVAVGGKVPANPHLWRIVDDKLYLNITDEVVGLWEEKIGNHISSADEKWLNLEKASASRKSIPEFTSAAPLQ